MILKDLWPVEKRPKTLQDKDKVSKMELKDIMSIYELHTLTEKEREGEQSEVLAQDTKPAVAKFKASDDDCFLQLHPAGFLRQPLAETTF